MDKFPYIEVIDDLENTFESLGGIITSRRTANTAEEFNDILTAIKVEAPQAIFYFGDNLGNAALLNSTAHGLGMNDVYIGCITF